MTGYSSKRETEHFLLPWASLLYLFLAALLLTILIWALSCSGKPTAIDPSKQKEFQAIVFPDISPICKGPSLTLASGISYCLDSASNGTIKTIEADILFDFPKKQLLFKSNGVDTNGTLALTDYNVLTTPCKSKCSVILADGSQVWLNAGTALYFPTSFSYGERLVKIKGEAYFKIAHLVDHRHRRIPFRVSILNAKESDRLIQLDGSYFNICSYPNEEISHITVLEGSAQILTRDKKVKFAIENSQQLVFDALGGMFIVPKPKLGQETAWMTGYFEFSNSPIEPILQRISRWYGVKFVYRDKIDTKFTGKLPMNQSLSIILEGIQNTGNVSFAVTDKTIFVSKVNH